MCYSSAPFLPRAQASVDFLRTVLQTQLTSVAAVSAAAAAACQHTTDVALGGKHLRSLLVHIGADRPDGPYQTDIAVGAAFDLLHAGFLVVDDVIDKDEKRRGVITVHAAARRAAAADPAVSPAAAGHYGNTVAVLAGMAAMNEATRLVFTCGVDPAAAGELMDVWTQATANSLMGEFLDVHHSLPHVHPSEKDVRLASRLKTASYTFEAPLCAGALIAGHPQRTAALRRVGWQLGAAFQLADDLNNVFADPAHTGKDPAGDLGQRRSTPLVGLVDRTPYRAQFHQAVAQRDLPQVREILTNSGAVAALSAEIAHHLQLAAGAADQVGFSPAARESLDCIAATIAEVTDV